MLHAPDNSYADDEIWHAAKHEQVHLPWIDDLPPVPEKLDERLRFHGGELHENDVFQAVAYFLCSYYGSVAWNVTAEVVVRPIDTSACAKVEGSGTPSSQQDSPSKRCYGEELGDMTVRDGAANKVASPAASPNKRYRCKDPELLQEFSQRLHGKQPGPRPVTIRRNTKLCQAEGCMFSTGQPGQPARSSATFCMWCDPAAMEVELGSKAGKTKIAKALSLFSTHAATHCAALAKLPEEFATDCPEYCRSPSCVFNEMRPGCPARVRDTGGSLCLWCDPALLKQKLATTEGMKLVRRKMTIFCASDGEVYRRAMSLVPESFHPTAGHYCQAAECPFNTKRPGHAAACTEQSDYCIWHDSSALDAALETPEGCQSVRRALSLLKQSGSTQNGVPLWELALDILPLDFALSARMCANTRCRFSLRHPGMPARAHEKSDLCAWCDAAILAGRESTVQGRRLIAFAMSRWIAQLDILLAAWCKLSTEFREGFIRTATQHVERQGMEKNDFVSHSMWVTSVWEQAAMEQHDFATYPRRVDTEACRYATQGRHAAPSHGLTCALCGETWLWRTNVKTFEIHQGAIEDPLSYDRRGATHDNAGLNTGRRLSDGRTGADILMCTLCYQARCGHCAGSLRFHEYLWSDECLHCGMSMLPEFARRPIICRPTSVWPPWRLTGHAPLRGPGDPPQCQSQACVHTMALECSCCGARSRHSTFCYLSWDDYDYPRLGAYGQRQEDMRVSRPLRRPGWLCQSCKDGRGVYYMSRNQCTWAFSSVAFYGNGVPYFWKCQCRTLPRHKYF